MRTHDVQKERDNAAVAQDGARVVRALPAAVPSPDPVSGATTTGGRATFTVRDRL